MTVRPNRIVAANKAVADLVTAVFADDAPAINPGGHTKPKSRAAGELASYVAMTDDKNAEVLATMMGPVYDLAISPVVTFAFSGGVKEAREAAAWAKLQVLQAALEGDRRLGAAVDYAELIEPEVLEGGGEGDWLAGGLEVRVRLLFTAPSQAG